MYGVKTEHWRRIYAILGAERDSLSWVKLFGSRVRGDERPTSDVDLAFSGREEVRARLEEALEESDLPYSFDIVDYDRQGNEKLRRCIDNEGKLLFAAEGGRQQVTREQIRLKWEEYHRALGRLRTAAATAPDEAGLYLDATIQRFEFSFELSWKLLRGVLSYDGLETSSPRGSIRESWKQGWIDAGETWLDMLEKRNLSAHTYQEATAQEIYRNIKGDYIDLLTALDEKVAAWLGEEPV